MTDVTCPSIDKIVALQETFDWNAGRLVRHVATCSRCESRLNKIAGLRDALQTRDSVDAKFVNEVVRAMLATNDRPASIAGNERPTFVSASAPHRWVPVGTACVASLTALLLVSPLHANLSPNDALASTAGVHSAGWGILVVAVLTGLGTLISQMQSARAVRNHSDVANHTQAVRIDTQ